MNGFNFVIRDSKTWKGSDAGKAACGHSRGHSPAPHCPQAGPWARAELCGGLRCQAGGCARHPGNGQCPMQNTSAKEAKSSPPWKKSRKRTCFSEKELKPLSLFVNACMGVGLRLEVRDVFTQVHRSIWPVTWWCTYNPLWSFKRSEIKMRVWGGSWRSRDWCVWHGVPYPSGSM